MKRRSPAGNGAEDASHEAAHEEHTGFPVHGNADLRARAADGRGKVHFPQDALVPGRHGVEDAAAVEAIKPEEGARKGRPGADKEHLGVGGLQSRGDLFYPVRRNFVAIAQEVVSVEVW